MATLIVIAGNRSEDLIGGGGDDEGGDLDDYELWREIKKQVKALRDDMDSHTTNADYDQLPLRDSSIEETFESGLARSSEMGTALTQPMQRQLPYQIQGKRRPTPTGIQNPRLLRESDDWQGRRAPLVNDNGVLMDNKVDGIQELELL